MSGEVIAIDGKAVRRSLDKASGPSAIHRVSAWAHHLGDYLSAIALVSHHRSKELMGTMSAALMAASE